MGLFKNNKFGNKYLSVIYNVSGVIEDKLEIMIPDNFNIDELSHHSILEYNKYIIKSSSLINNIISTKFSGVKELKLFPQYFSYLVISEKVLHKTKESILIDKKNILENIGIIRNKLLEVNRNLKK